MSRESGALRRGVSVTLIGNGIFAASQFAMLAGLAQLTTATVVGQYALAIAVTAPFYMLASMKLRYVQVTDVADDFSPAQYLGARLAAVTLLTACFIATAVLRIWPAGTGPLVAGIALLKALDLVSDILFGALHKRALFNRIAISLSIRGCTSAVAFLFVMWGTSEVLHALAASIIVYAIGVVVDARLAAQVQSLRPTFSPQRLRPVIVTTLPLGLSIAVSSISTNTPRYALQHFSGPEAVGIYSAAVYVLVVGGLVIAAMGQAASPHLADRVAAGDFRGFQQLILRLVLCGFGMAVAATLLTAVAGEALLTLLFGQAYASAADALVILVASTIPSYSAVFLGTGVNALREFKVQFPISLTSGLVVAAVSLVIIPGYGVNGAAVAILAGSSVDFIAYWLIIGPRIKRAVQRGSNVGSSKSSR